MKHIQVNESYLLNIFVFHLVFITAACYPIQKLDLEAQSEHKNEKHFPNGTTIGKYTYMDNEGNPIQVKYYADEASYGVELKSIKVVDPVSESSEDNSNQNSLNKIETNTDTKMAADLLNNNKYPNFEDEYKYKDHKLSNPYDYFNKEISKTDRYKVNKQDKPDSDYEIFYQNELTGPKKCNKEKVRVYFDNREKRKVRGVDNNLDEAENFCKQFS